MKRTAGTRKALRWLQRLTPLSVALAAGFLPYDVDVSGPCRTAPNHEAGVRALLDDEIEFVHVMEGQFVSAGYVVATLAAREEQARVETARARLAHAQANLDLLRAGSRTEDIRRAELMIELLEVKCDFVESELERAAPLIRAKVVTQEEVEQLQRGLKGAEQVQAVWRERVAKRQAGPRKAEIQAAEASVDAHAAALKHAERMFALRHVKAPIEGHISTRHHESRQGQPVACGDLIAVIQDATTLKVEVQAAESAAAFVRPGMTAKIRLHGTYGELIQGRVASVGASAARRSVITRGPSRSDRESMGEDLPRTGDESASVLVVVEIDADSQAALSPGMSGYARIAVRGDCFWSALARHVRRFLCVDVWSWLP